MASISEAYRNFKSKYAIYLLPLLFGGILYVLAISLQTIYVVVAIGYFLLIIPYIQKLLSEKFNQKDDEDIGREYLQQKWKDKSGETLSIRDGWSTSTYFGNKGRLSLFYAFVLNRGGIGDKKHLPFVGVVQIEPLRIAGWSDDPSLEVRKDPFKLLSSSFRGSPSPDMNAELEPSLRSGFGFKKPKEKRQESENETDSSNMVVTND